jgi:hypothetical protein
VTWAHHARLAATHDENRAIRYMSLLSHFNDERLDAGIAEMRQARPGSTVTFTDTFAFVLGSVA